MHYCFLACLIVIVGATISSWAAVWILDASAEWNWATHILYASASMNTAWLCVASSIQALVYIGKDVHHSDFSTLFSNEVYLSILFTLIAVAITLQRVVSTGNPYFPGVCVWALTAIQSKNKDNQSYELRDYVDALHVLAIFVLVYAILECFLKRFVPGVRDTVREALGVERQSTTLADVYDTLHEQSTDLNE
ncbi:hypothetical protein SARC_01768 [Sphaeroforma arctica JP610]|uniref:Uncharacterized protein n=1 Tax=Sphaeroforma arctica JP610 TaxID=667725 RepID=A0A0L0GB20_9EUKA|nr:hypothetical protein SARC_01768 [Sphaeroforma arctica JP610]KNC86076.1 hypothetical protein SARC_01768 [Sphaeroforma arctica JP610]|eukprot:XP_014159978.1 hypothetical protein SARC_01768 [Sphaeroforma arctica JP610]